MAYARFAPTYRYGASVAGLTAAGFSGNRSSWMRGRSRTSVAYGNKRRGNYYAGSSLTRKIRSMESTKHAYVGNATNLKLTMLDNVIYTWSPSVGVPIGTGEGSREGTEIYMMALRCSIQLQSPAASQNGCTYRIITFFADPNYPLGGAMGAGFGATGLFGDVALAIVTNALTDPKLITVLDDRVVNIDPVITGVKNSEDVSFTVPINRKFIYNTTAAVSQYGKVHNLYQVVIGHQIGGTGGITDVGDIYVSTDLIFKNSK